MKGPESSSPLPPSSTGAHRALGLPSAGDVLAGKYSVEAVLGVGGMAVVVAARHMELDERVALKILLPKYRSNEEMVARFRREARAAVKIKSEHVARVHDVGTLEDGAPCLVMEYLEGQDLETLLEEQGPIQRELAVDYILQACEALAEAHGLGVVHRDLKPANLFLAQKADGTSTIKLLDFGISKVSGRGLTRKKASFGTPHYMSPEQLRASEDVDARADVWGIGAILQELITGQPPFDAEDLTELQSRIKSGAPRPLREGGFDAPQALESVVLRCLAKEPSKRFASVAELAEALSPFGSPGASELAANVARVGEAALARAAVIDSELTRPPTPIAFSPVPPTSIPVPSSSNRPVAEALKVSTKTSIAIDGETGDVPPRSRVRGVVLGALIALPLLAAGVYGARVLAPRWNGGAATAYLGASAAAAPTMSTSNAPATNDTAAAEHATPTDGAGSAPSTPSASAPPITSASSLPSASAATAPSASSTPSTKSRPPPKRPKAAKSGERLFDDRK